MPLGAQSCRILSPSDLMISKQMARSETGTWNSLVASRSRVFAQGLIRGEIEAAAQRASAGRGLQSSVCDAPGRGECAAAGWSCKNHQESSGIIQNPVISDVEVI